MIREQVRHYVKKNKASIAYSYLECWFTSKHQGVSKKECRRMLKEEYDFSSDFEYAEENIEYEEAGKKFELEDREKEYIKNQLIEEILSKLIFEGASLWMDDKGREYKKSIE